MKYKVGDRVLVKDIKIAGGVYHMEDGKEHNSFVHDMLRFAGEVVTIDEYVNGQYRVKEDCGHWLWVDGMFEGLDKKCKIVITTDGKTTTARLFDGKKLVKKAEARCSPDDTFDFMFGAKLAVERLEEEKKPVNPFKVGDYVKITGGESFGHCLPVGSVGMVTEVQSDNCYVDGFWNGKHCCQHVSPEELEKI